MKACGAQEVVGGIRERPAGLFIEDREAFSMKFVESLVEVNNTVYRT